MRHPIIRAIHSYWLELAAGRIMPNRTELDPRRLGTALPNVFLLDDIRTGASFRLAGSNLAAQLGHEPTGLIFTELFADQARDNARSSLNWAARDGEPVLLGIRALDQTDSQATIIATFGPAGTPADLARSMADRRNAERRPGEMILLPLLHKGVAGARILGGLAFAERPRERPRHPLRLAVTGTRVLGRATRPATALGLVRSSEIDTVIARRGHLALLRGYGGDPAAGKRD